MLLTGKITAWLGCEEDITAALFKVIIWTDIYSANANREKNPQAAVFFLFVFFTMVHFQLCPVRQKTHTIDSLTKTIIYMLFSILFMDLFSLSYSPSYLVSLYFLISSLIVCSLRSFRFPSVRVCVWVWSLGLCCGNKKQVLSWYQMSYQCFIADISLVIPAWCVLKLLDELKRMSLSTTHKHLFSYHGWGFIWTFCPVNACCVRTFSLFTLPVTASLESVWFLMFLKEVSSAHQCCIYLIKN